MITKIVDAIGAFVLASTASIGNFMLFFLRVVKTILTTRPKFKHIFANMKHIGVDSFSIIFLTGAFTGLALALQGYIGLHRLGTENFIGFFVAIGMTRELGPVLTGLMITGRAGSSIAAEIGTMAITEQIDALTTLCIDPFQYLIVPRIIAGTFILPFLTVIAIICGVLGGYFFCSYALGQSYDMFITAIRQRLELSDITGGLIKSSVFGLILTWVGCYNGYETTGGARGVGIATTKSVAVGSILILIANYFLSSLLFQTGIS